MDVVIQGLFIFFFIVLGTILVGASLMILVGCFCRGVKETKECLEAKRK